MSHKFTIKDFNKAYPDDNACLSEIFDERYGDLGECPSCKKETKFYRIKNRKCYSCQSCGRHIYPLANTIFHKSKTSLKNWFFSIYLFASSKNGVSAKELERQLGVTYKCAWRIAKQVRLLFSEVDDEPPLGGIVEADETYIGGKSSNRHKSKRGYQRKTPVVGVLERKGKIRTKVTRDVTLASVLPLLRKCVKPKSTLMTDDFGVYDYAKEAGFDHYTIKHSYQEYVRGNIHTNSIEGFWSQMKRSINGTYHAVSSKYLQSYADEFAYRYSHRDSEFHIFPALIAKAAQLA